MELCDLLNEYYGKNVILIDLSWILYRSYYAFKDLTTQEGEPTGQWYGLVNTIMRLSNSYPDALILLVDDGCPVERKELNESYKGNREHGVHFEDKHNTVDLLIQPLPNVYRVYHPYLEADDLLYSISRYKDYQNHFIIHTSDKDLLQAIDSTTTWSNKIEGGLLVEYNNNSTYYIDNFSDLEPWQLPYYRAVLGDASDNLPIIRPRFPSKVAYYFAKNNIYKLQDGSIAFKKLYDTPKEDLTERQFECLDEIYKSEQFMNNLAIMRLMLVDEIPIIEKNKDLWDTNKLIDELELNQYSKWLKGKGFIE